MHDLIRLFRLNIGATAAIFLLCASSFTLAAERITYYHTDALGSPVAATDEQGNVVWQESYEPYGERIKKQPSSTTNSRWYTGHPLDAETGLNYAGARYYDPVIGRFMGVDPKSFDEDDPTSFNSYSYVGNNPYRYIDPDGRARRVIVEGAGLPPSLGPAGGPAMQRSLPQTTAPPSAPTGKPVEITIDKGRYPESARHVEDAVRAGKPDTLTIDRAGAAERRRDALRGSKPSSGLDRDEYPPAMFKEGGGGASVRPMNPGDNRGAGACVGAQCRNLPEGTQIKIKVVK